MYISQQNMVTKIISGGQSGADMAALLAGSNLGIETGGYAPQKYMTEYGSNYDLKKYGLVETKSSSYPYRTRLNVDNSDGTLVFRYKSSVGTDCTIGYAQTGQWKKGSIHNKSMYKPVCIITGLNDDDNVELIKNFVNDNKINVLNVAGHRESQSPFPNYTKYVENILCKALDVQKN